MADTTKTYTLPFTAEEIENLLKSVSQGGVSPGGGLPEVTVDDDGKVLGVEGGEWKPVELPEAPEVDGSLPEITADDAGKVLTANKDGAAEWKEPTSGEGVTMVVNVTRTDNGTFEGVYSSDKSISEILEAHDNGKKIVFDLLHSGYHWIFTDGVIALTNRTPYQGLIEYSNDIMYFTADNTTTENNVDSFKASMRENNELPESTEEDFGKVLTVCEDGTAGWKEPTGGDTSLTITPQSISWDGSSEYTIINKLAPATQELVGATGTLTVTDTNGTQVRNFSISAACQTSLELENYLADNETILAVPGPVLNGPPSWTIIGLVMDSSFIPFAYFDLNTDQMKIMRISSEDNTISFYLSSLDYNTVRAKANYQGYYNSIKNPIKVLSIAGGIDSFDFSLYQPGDILLLVTDELQGASNGI